MAAKKKRRIRSPHPGVVLIPPKEEHATWRARCDDPDTDGFEWVRLDPVELPSPETRKDWAERKSETIAKRRMDLKAGAPRATGTSVEDVIKRYYQDHPRLRPRTLAVYRGASDKFVAWCKGKGLESADDITVDPLSEFAGALAGETRRVPERGEGTRGKRKPSTKPRSVNTVNKELRAMRTILGYVRGLRLLPRLPADDLQQAVKRHRAPKKRIVFLKLGDVQRLMEAALAHDEIAFAETREEHAGRREKGTTKRYEPIALFVAFVLLTGMRVGEALSLEWKEMDLDATDIYGRPVGEIYLVESKNKTGSARTVTLEVSPFLRRMLLEMRSRKRKRRGPPVYSEWVDPVFDLNYDVVDAAQRRLREGIPAAGDVTYAAPRQFSYQVLRATCSSFLVNAPGIFGAASPYRSAKQLGHSVEVAEKHYTGLISGIPFEHKTVEAAMGIEALCEKAFARMFGHGASHGDSALQQPVDRGALN